MVYEDKDQGFEDYSESDGEEHNKDDDDDFPYEDELDKAKGDAEEIVDEREARWRQEELAARIDQFEIMCDEAALRGEDIEEPEIHAEIHVRLEQSKGSSSNKRKGRGATKGVRVSEPIFLEFDDLDRPRGRWRLKYGQHIGFCMRKFNICWNWKDVSKGNKKLMWQDTMNLFHIKDQEKLKKKFLSLVAKRFRDFKSKLVSGWITKTRQRTKSEDGREPPDIWKHIKVEDWRLFQQLKSSSPAKRKREKAIESASKNDHHHHHLGQNDFTAARSIWIKDGFYPGITLTPSSTGDESETVKTVDVNRADDWYCSMHIK